MSMETALHEIGHMWYRMPGSGTGCEIHTEQCTGINKFGCLWQAECSGTGGGHFSVDQFILQSIASPTFCEGLQQAFMNKLRPGE